MANHVTLISLPFRDEVKSGDCIAQHVQTSLMEQRVKLQNGDIVVVTHKVISKAEGVVVDLNAVECSEEALRYADLTGRDPRLLQVILDDSTTVIRYGANLPFVTRHKLGYVSANSAVDQSNAGKNEHVIRLPENPDKSAENIRLSLEEEFNVEIAVIVSDTHGRAFRKGSMGVALGISGIAALKNFIGMEDRDGRVLKGSIDAQADLLASAAMLLMGQAAENVPFVLIRGYEFERVKGRGADLVRAPEQDLFAGTNTNNS